MRLGNTIIAASKMVNLRDWPTSRQVENTCLFYFVPMGGSAIKTAGSLSGDPAWTQENKQSRGVLKGESLPVIYKWQGGLNACRGPSSATAWLQETPA